MAFKAENSALGGIASAGTAEGYVRAGMQLYKCSVEEHSGVVAHLAWVWYCPLCKERVVGPHANIDRSI